MINYLRKLWHKQNRDLDIAILWPVCKEQAVCLSDAKFAFTVHCVNDNAWMCLGENELYKIIGGSE